MNIQTVKIADQNSSERWNKKEEPMLIAKQKELLNALSRFNNESVTEKETGQWLLEQLMAITENVLNHGVKDWCEPQFKYSVAKYWIKATKLVPLLYGELGESAIAFVRKQFERSLCVEVALAREDTQFKL